MMILIVGPYRSGTGDDPAKMAENLERLETAALEVYRRGHLPVIGEWVALPLMRRAGMERVGDTVYQEFAYPASHRLLRCCDAIFRIGGESAGADGDVRLAGELGMTIFRDVDEIPAILSEEPHG
jgi:hypothetical protein